MPVVVLLQVLVDLVAAGAYRDRVESQVRAGRVGEVDDRTAALMNAGYYERNTERPDPGVLRVLLVEVGDLLGDALDVDRIVVDQAVALRDHAGVVNLNPSVRYVPGTHRADVVVYL